MFMLLFTQTAVCCSILARIENQQGLVNLEPILDAADGVIVSRGTLALALSPEKVALAQNIMTTRCNMRGKVLLPHSHLRTLPISEKRQEQHGIPLCADLNSFQAHAEVDVQESKTNSCRDA